MIRVCFVMEQQIGHQTFYRNLRRFASAEPEIDARWVEVTYWQENGRWERLPLVPGGIKGPLRGLWQVRRGLENGPFDVAVFNTQVPAVLSLGHFRRAPAVVITDITPIQYDSMGRAYGHRADRRGPLKGLKYRASRRVFQGAAWVVPWSHWVRQSLLADYGVPEARIQVIPPGVDLTRWRPAGGQARPEGGRVRLLFVGGDFWRKGGDLLLEVFRQMDRERVELHLVTREAVPHEPGIRVYHHMKPNSPELIGLYQQSHVFVLPSRAEAFGIAAVEAQAAGLPAVVARSGGIADVVTHSQTGFIVPPDDANALAQSLRALVENPSLRAEMGLRARQAAENRFDAQKNVARLLALVKQAAVETHGK
ncbi:MAG: glycosyltransferase family 4 protein [Chloroflexota bacterium]